MSGAKGTESPPQTIDVSAALAAPAEPSELAPFGLDVGSTLAGKYRIEEVIGSGGMSVVVRALHTLLGQPVALKLLRPELASDPVHVERFLREALAAAQLKNEHVVRIHDADRLPDGAPYLVMEVLEGLDLAKLLLARGPLPVAEVVYYVLQACEAVAEAHARGIVHRDLKPSNLFLTRTPEGAPCVKVLDFGISKLEASLEDLRLTGTMVVLGSPLHMSPEQIRDSRTVDRRTDIWSLGTLAFELLTGRPPFLADTAAALIARISADRPEPLSSFRSDVPPALDTVLLRCLEKDRTQRIQSVDELVRLLSPFAPAEAWTHIEQALKLCQGVAWPPRGGDTQRISDAGELLAAVAGEEHEPEASVGLRTRRVERPGKLGAPTASSSVARASTTGGAPVASVVGWGTTHRPPASERRRGRRALTLLTLALGVASLAGAALWWSEPSASEPSGPVIAGALPGAEASVAAARPSERSAAGVPEPPAVESSVPAPAQSVARAPSARPRSRSKAVAPPKRARPERASKAESAPNPSMFEERR